MNVVVALVAGGTAIRLLLAWTTAPNYDGESYQLVARIIAEGGNVYGETHRYNYSPLWFLTLGGLDALSGPLVPWVRTLLSTVDALTAVLIWRMTHRPLAVAAFALNPVSILLTAHHAAFDNLAVLFVLLGLHLRRDSIAVAGVVVKASVLPALLWAVRGPFRYRIALGAVAVGAMVALTLPWATTEGARTGILHNVVLYPLGMSDNSYSSIPQSVMRGIAYVLLVVGGIVYAPRLTHIEAMAAWPLTLLAFMPGASEQMYLLPIAAGAMIPSIGFAGYTVGATISLLGSPDSVAIPWLTFLAGWPASAAAAAWAISLVSRSAWRSQPVAPAPIRQSSPG